MTDLSQFLNSEQNAGYTDLFDLYLENQMSDSVRSQFEKELENSAILQKAFIFHQEVIEGIKQFPTYWAAKQKVNKFEENFQVNLNKKFTDYLGGKMDLENQTTFEEELKTNDFLRFQFEKFKEEEIDTPVRRLNIKFYAIAAAVCLILCMTALLLWMPKTTMNNQTAFAKYYQKPDKVFIPLPPKGATVEEEMISDLDQQAKQAYLNKDYPTCIHLFEKRIKLHPDNLEVQFLNLYIGIAYLETNDFNKSIQALKKAESFFIDQDRPIRIESIRHYLGLAYLKQGKVKEAIPYFELLEEATKKEFDSSEILKDIRS